MNQAHPCPYCGMSGGSHMWAGSGGCPGAATAAIKLVTKITADDMTQYVIAKEAEIKQLKALCVRAADALDKINVKSFSRGLTAKERVEVDELIDELRKAE